MRQIKFRAWDKINKRWLNISSLAIAVDNSVQGVYELRSGDNELYGRHQFELVQFTGLLDKNGKEIYEGDILGRVKRPLFEKPTGEMETTVVEFVRGEFGCRTRTSQSHPTNAYFFTDGNPYPYEVIGNIYENPELLK